MIKNERPFVQRCMPKVIVGGGALVLTGGFILALFGALALTTNFSFLAQVVSWMAWSAVGGGIAATLIGFTILSIAVIISCCRSRGKKKATEQSTFTNSPGVTKGTQSPPVIPPYVPHSKQRKEKDT